MDVALTTNACLSSSGSSSAKRLDTSALKAVWERLDRQRLTRVELGYPVSQWQCHFRHPSQKTPGFQLFIRKAAKTESQS